MVKKFIKSLYFVLTAFILLSTAAPANLVHAATPIKVACIGDSITYGSGSSDRSTKSYPAVLQTLLGSNYEVKNFGVSGSTLLKSGDKPYWNQQAFTDSSNYLPDIVIIMLGTNDSKPANWQYKDSFVADYEAMISHYRSLSSNPRIYVNTSPTVASSNFGITEAVVTGEVVPKQIQVANSKGCPIIDVNTATKGMPANFSDGVHPNDSGYAVIANEVYKGLSGTNLALNKTGTASSTWSSTYTAAKALDGTTSTRWSAASGQTADQWLAVSFGASTTCSKVVVKETSYERVTSYKLQYSDDGTTYTDIPGTSGTSIGASKTITFAPVTAKYIRLYINTANNVPTINELEVYGN